MLSDQLVRGISEGIPRTSLLLFLLAAGAAHTLYIALNKYLEYRVGLF